MFQAWPAVSGIVKVAIRNFLFCDYGGTSVEKQSEHLYLSYTFEQSFRKIPVDEAMYMFLAI